MVVMLAALALAAPANPLQAIADKHAALFNVSLSMAARLSSGEVIAGAAGLDDHAVGSKVTTASLYPSGSVTKTFTAVAAMRLVDQGKLELDKPFHAIVDPWLKAQGNKTLVEMWGDKTIETVTVRHLLSMRSGIRDYNDEATREWTIKHPTEDLLPSEYVASVDKRFLFKPDHGGAYTGVGYVLLGWVLCASTPGCHTWADLDQKAMATPSGENELLRTTQFMKAGPCSKYPGVVHQYLFAPGSQLSWSSEDEVMATDETAVEGEVVPPARGDKSARHAAELRYSSSASHGAHGGMGSNHESKGHMAAPLPHHCTNPSKTGQSKNWYDHVKITGPTLGNVTIPSGGAASCCAHADTVARAALWTFAPSGLSGAGTCHFYPYVQGVKGSFSLSATSGRVDALLRPSDFIDLYSDSCLNGWTMGNIAPPPREIVEWYGALFSGELVSSAAIKQMTTFQKLTTGFEPGLPYGFGLMAGEIAAPLKDVKTCGQLPACKCSGTRGCYFTSPTVGHAGLDYGSGMPIIGFMTALNVSYALASNTGESPMGMNFSKGQLENSKFFYSISCEFLDVVVHAQLPTYPAFKCGDSA